MGRKKNKPEYLAERSMKEITRQVRVYQIGMPMEEGDL